MTPDSVNEKQPAGRLSGWLVRAAGAALAMGTMEMALTLGLAQATGLGESALRLIALVLGALLAPTRAARLMWLATSVTALLLLLVLFTPLVERPIRSLLRADAPGARADAIVVYSGSMTDGGHIGEMALSRLVSALDDAQRLGIRDLVVSEQQRDVRGNMISTVADQQRLAGLLGGGVTVHVVRNVHNTHDESLAFAALARTKQWSRLHAVTDPLHARRACATLEATGVGVMCAPSTPRHVSFSQLDSPGARITATRAALHEAVGYTVYRLRGWL